MGLVTHFCPYKSSLFVHIAVGDIKRVPPSYSLNNFFTYNRSHPTMAKKVSHSFSENEAGDRFTVPKWGRNYTFVVRHKQREFLSSYGHWPHQEGPPTPWQTWSSFQKGGEWLGKFFCVGGGECVCVFCACVFFVGCGGDKAVHRKQHEDIEFWLVSKLHLQHSG